MQNWKIIAASVAGTSHIFKNELCADAFKYEVLNDEILLIIVSDGAGSAKSGRAGAETTCAFFSREIRSWFEHGGKMQNLNKDFGLSLFEKLQAELTRQADDEQQTLPDFACTLLAAIVGKNAAAFFQIGDGAIVYSLGDENYVLARLPQQGEYANTTNFVTDATAIDVLTFDLIEKQITEIAVFTDGLQRIALDYKTNTAHAPFFRSMFAPLRAAEIAPNLEKKLTDFLASPRINERTDDDKTLILASRN
jgi:serine/threonine protein phosphatase PrpC